MAEVRGCLVEEREEMMVSPMGSSMPTLRKAHFLKPPEVSTFTLSGSTSLPQPSPVVPSTFKPKGGCSRLFPAWGFHKSDWEEWVKHLKPEYESVWKQAGIYSAIIGSTLTCEQDYELIMGLAEKWCPETNSFVFPWGEATLTLEDVAILGGYSVLGSPVFQKTKVKETAEVELAKAVKELAKGGSPNYVSQGNWKMKFKGSGSDIEHEAFLSMWLHPILFGDSSRRMKLQQFCLATRLAKGERFALAPAVLAGIYRDLSFLKSSGRQNLNSQIHFVQLWAWERFPAFQPLRNCIKVGDPRSFMWHNVKPEKVNNVSLALDSAGQTFCWRPYTLGINGWEFPRFYMNKEGFQNLESDDDVHMFAICLRVSKVVGLDCVENYFPHRVALQFGLDQDIPCNFVVEFESLEDAWFDYTRPFEATRMFMSSRLFEPDVTVSYLEWWKKQMISFTAGGPPRFLDDVMHKRKRTSVKRLKRVHENVVIGNANNTGDVSGAYSPYCIIIDDSDEDGIPDVERRVCEANTTLGNNLSLDDPNGRLCAKGCTDGGMKSTAGEVGESTRASGQIGTSAGMGGHVSAEKDDNPLHCQENLKGNEEENGNHTSKVPGMEINCGYSPKIIDTEETDHEGDKQEADRRVCDADTTSENNLSLAEWYERICNRGCTNDRMEPTAAEARESATNSFTPNRMESIPSLRNQSTSGNFKGEKLLPVIVPNFSLFVLIWLMFWVYSRPERAATRWLDTWQHKICCHTERFLLLVQKLLRIRLYLLKKRCY